MNTLLQNLCLSLDEHHVHALLVTKDENISYLTGYPSQESWLLVVKNKAFFFTDGRYSLHAKGFLKGVNVVECKKSIFVELAEIVFAQGVGSLGFDERFITVLAFNRLKEALKRRVKLSACNGIIEEMRAVKRKDELAKIVRALDFHRQCLGYLQKIVKPGKSEMEVFSKLERYVQDHGYRFSFPTIIASGPQASFPHARITGRKLRQGDVVLVDMGIDVDGYKSDLTRMFFLGKISQQIREAYDAVAQAQRLAIDSIKPGVLARDIDAKARNFLRQNKLDGFFNHSLGHGVGLEIHEAPGISPKSSSVLKEGMVFTVEPGVYIPGQFGIRIEDMVLVTAKGHKVLSQF